MSKVYLKTKDVTGQRFGKLTAIEYTGKTDSQHNTIWAWKCDCGNEFERRRSSVVGAIKLGRVPSCLDCREWPTIGLGKSNRNRVIDYYTRSASDKDLEFRLNDDQLNGLFESNCHYCGSVPSNVENHEDLNGKFVYQVIDRIDNELDYVPFNVIPCCKICNYAKRNINYLDFVAWIKQAAKHLEV